MLDGVAHAGILRHALVGEVYLAFSVHGDVFQQSIALDGVVDVGLAFLVKVDDLGIAAAFEVEHAVVVPSVLVVTDKQTLRVGREGGLARAGETEEDGGVFAVHVGVGRAVHGSNALQRQVVVHHGEHALLHLTAVPGVDNHLLAAGGVEGHASLAVQTELLVVFHLGFRSAVNHEVGLEVGQFLSRRLDEHVGHEVSLPGHFHHEAHGHAGVLVGAAEGVNHVHLLAAELLLGYFLHLGPHVFAHRVVVVLISLAGPPYGVLRVLVHHDVLVLGAAAGIDTCHYVHGTQFGYLAYFVTFQTGFGFFLKQKFIGRIVG